MGKLSEQEVERIISLIKEGKPLPEDYKAILFDTKKEYELIYADKEREEDILTDTMAVPLQPVKTFRNGNPPLNSPLAKGGKEGGWMNMLIFGDNLQVLKTLLYMKQEGQLKNSDGTPGVRLVYIDPPFATRQEFRGSEDQKAYQDKIAGANFLEFLRKRLVFLREILSENGSIYVHLDWKRAHYVKVLMDEIFNEPHFVNEIIWHYGGNAIPQKCFPRKHDSLLLYSKTYEQSIYPERIIEGYSELTLKRYNHVDEFGRRYKISALRDGKQEIVYAKEGRLADTVWNIPVERVKEEVTGYPTQKPSNLLERIIKSSSNVGDLILDCFAGSGTTLAVAEKLGRRWIGVDCGKLAIYTMQKRLLNIAQSKNLENPKLVPLGSKTGRKYGRLCKSFTLYNAGLYDYKMIKELPWEQYRDFAIKLFQCRDERHEISKIELDGYLGADSVMVFNYQKHKDAVMDRGFIDDLHKNLGTRIGKRFFIIAPAASVQFLEDYIQKGKTKYFVLRIPYSIIEEIHNRGFTRIKQPVSEMDVNDTVDAVGFDFIQTPTVECKYFIGEKKGQLELGKGSKECVIRIEKFESKVISRKPLSFANLETLSMVMLDYDFDGEVFDLDEVFYTEELKKHTLSKTEGNGYEVRFAKDKAKEQIMVIYIDIFGNEKREIKSLKDFEKK